MSVQEPAGSVGQKFWTCAACVHGGKACKIRALWLTPVRGIRLAISWCSFTIFDAMEYSHSLGILQALSGSPQRGHFKLVGKSNPLLNSLSGIDFPRSRPDATLVCPYRHHAKPTVKWHFTSPSCSHQVLPAEGLNGCAAPQPR
eukprot:1153578-Pelagomonas_calceolata.AAC.4